MYYWETGDVADPLNNQGPYLALVFACPLAGLHLPGANGDHVWGRPEVVTIPVLAHCLASRCLEDSRLKLRQALGR
jgi:hypothetical protein